MYRGLQHDLQKIEENIQKACQRANRKREDVRLIAVSKTQPSDVLQAAYDLGIRTFGENKVQELTGKYEILPKDIQWHMIGHLQRNKVKYIVDKVAMIHSVDSLALAEMIEKESAKKSCITDILLEVNVAEEATKFGLKTAEVLPLVGKLASFSHLHVCGLMTIAPFVENPEDNRSIFAELKKLSVDIANQNIDNISMGVLSMGMTNDYEVAIEEGATLIRVGTGIFGQRNYNLKE